MFEAICIYLLLGALYVLKMVRVGEGSVLISFTFYLFAVVFWPILLFDLLAYLLRNIKK